MCQMAGDRRIGGCPFWPGGGVMGAPGAGQDGLGSSDTRALTGRPSAGPAAEGYGLRARFLIWPPLRPTRLSFELEEVVAVRPPPAKRSGTEPRSAPDGSGPHAIRRTGRAQAFRPRLRL